MNDFTKEELELIAEAIPYILHKGVLVRTELLKKIDGMINNYCEHKEQEMDCDGGISLVCKYCGAITMDIM
jgi:hypothetical protein